MIQGVLFDLDGTLADTAPDLAYALNALLLRYDREPLTLERLRPQASHGARGLIEEGFGSKPGDVYFEELREQFLALYMENLCRKTALFTGIPELLDHLDTHKIHWGIVTNKLTRFTDPLVERLGLMDRASCVVSGDSYAKPKPFPDPLLGAAQEMELAPQTLIYVGDDERDMQAARAAGMPGIVARYGYLGSGRPPEQWNAQAMIDTPIGLISYLNHVH